MRSLLFLIVEFGLLFFIFISFLINNHKRWYLCLVVLIPLFCVVLGLLGYPKSAYHLILVAILFLSNFKTNWTPVTYKIIYFFSACSLACLCFLLIIQADWGLGSKTAAPQFYPLWGLFILFHGKFVLSRFSRFFMVIDCLISLVVAARGVFLGSALGFISSSFSKNISKKLVKRILYFLFFIYVFTFPVLLLIGKQIALQESASNAQRALMNYQALVDVVRNYSFFNEKLIFESSRDYQYSHDSDALTVHNFFLAIGLLNGFPVAATFFLLVIRSIISLHGSIFLPLGIYMYTVMLLGPDGFNTRFAVIFLTCLVILSSKNTREIQGRLANPVAVGLQ